MIMKNRLAVFRNGLIGLLHIFLMVPVLFFFMELNRIPGERYVLTFFLVTQLIAFLFSKWWLFLPIQIGYVLYTLYSLYPSLDTALSFWGWLQETWSQLVLQWTNLLQAELDAVPLLLIFCLLFLLISFLTYLSIHRKMALPSFLVSFTYLMIVHTFTDNRVLMYMVPLLGIGFLFIALMRLNINTSWFHFIKSFVITAGFTIGLITFSFWGIDQFRSSQEWVEDQFHPYQRTLDDRGFFDWINTYSIGVGYQRTGFGLDDSNLGGPLQQDFTPLFRAYTEEPHYWKVLHRTEYTGTGWEDNTEEYPASISNPSNREAMYSEESNVDELFSTITLNWNGEVDYIAYPYGWTQFDLDDQSAESTFNFHVRSHYYTVATELEDSSSYTVTYDDDFPDQFDEQLLEQDNGWRQEANDNLNDIIGNEDPVSEDMIATVFEQELQLPPTLPQRVIDLAEEITEGLDSEYDMVRAIESYLKEEGGYRYSLLEVENTPEGEDYVDYFLFDSLIGYCDNFSSAMTVLLRAVGIPARWTKGFTPGSYHENGQNESYFQVNNSNAHSWVEVYFPSFGWIPFEPSPSFDHPMTSTSPVVVSPEESYSFEDDDFIDLDDVGDEPESTPEEDNSVEEPEESEDLRGSAELIAESDTDDPSFTINWTRLFNTLTLLFILVSIFLLLFKWVSLTWLLKFIIDKSKLSLEHGTQLVLKLFGLKQKRAPGHTVEDYINKWKPFLSDDSDVIEQFIILANRAFYSQDNSKEPMTNEEKQILMNMIDLYLKAPNLKKSKSKDNSII